jgi:hypothetical protein
MLLGFALSETSLSMKDTTKSLERIFTRLLIHRDHTVFSTPNQLRISGIILVIIAPIPTKRAGTTLYTKFAIEMGEVFFNCVNRDAKLFGDRFVRFFLSKQPEDLPFAWADRGLRHYPDSNNSAHGLRARTPIDQ